MELEDRLNETPKLISLFNSFGNEKSDEEDGNSIRGIVVYAASGIGKTALISDAFEQVDMKALTVKVRRSSGGMLPPGYYFKLIHEAFEKNYPDYIYRNKKKWATGASIAVSLPIPSVTVGVSPERIAMRDEDERRIKAESMIDYCLNEKVKPVFFCEESQHIDDDSLALIFLLAEKIKEARFVFEYSILPPFATEEQAIRFARSFAQIATCEESIFLEQLAFGEAKAAISKKVPAIESLDNSTLRAAYEEAQGNLIVFEERCRRLVKEASSSPSQLQATDIEKDFVLALIALSQKPVDSCGLYEMIKMMPVLQLDLPRISYICEALSDSGSVDKYEDEGFGIASANISERALKKREPAFLAYGTFSNYMSCKLSKNESIEDGYRLINAQLRFRDEHILDTLNQMKNVICRSPIPDYFVLEATKMVRELRDKEGAHTYLLKRVGFAFFDILFTAADYDSARKFLEVLETDSSFDLCRFAVDATVSDAKNMEERADLLLDSYQDNERLCLFVRLNLVSYLMRYGERAHAIRYAQNVLAEESLKKYPEYWWILKQYSMFQPRNQSVSSLKKCCEQFSKLGDNELYARTRITYALHLAISGRVCAAEEIFRADLSARLDPNCRLYFYLNDIAACHLLKGTQIEEAIELLERALAYPATPYTKMFMLNNLFIAHMLNNDYKAASTLLPRINENVTQGYTTHAYLHLRYTNLLKYYEDTGDTERASEIKVRLMSLKNESFGHLRACIEAQMAGRQVNESNDYRYVTDRGFRPGFIGYWQMKIAPEFFDYLLARHQ